MISKLKYKLTFSNGREMAQDLNLTGGSTLITGKNGQGKSLNFEMIAFSLFGNKALRGVASDYKKMKVHLTVGIKETTYEIDRTKSGATVSLKGEQIASGNSPVNNWVTRNLGYDFNVFRIAHWCAQGDIQALADMRPTERKQMIDSVAGLTQMDSLSNRVAQKAKNLRTEIDAIQSVLVVPNGPAKLDFDPTKCEGRLTALQGLLDAYSDYAGKKNPSEPSQPSAPIEPGYPDEPTEMKVADARPVAPKAPNGLPSTSQQLSGLDVAMQGKLSALLPLENRYLELEAKIDTTVPKILASYKDDRDKLARHWDEFTHWTRIKELQDASEVDCPKCGHHFYLNAEIESLKKEKAFREATPKMTVAEWDSADAQVKIAADFEKTEAEYKECNIAVVRDTINLIRNHQNEVSLYESNLKAFLQRESQMKSLYLDQLSNWRASVDKTKKQYNAQLLAYNTNLNSYKVNMAAFEKAKTEYDEAQGIINKILADYDNSSHNLHKAITAVQNQIWTSKSYAEQLAAFEQAKVKYDEKQAELEVKRDQADQYNKARAAIKEVKARVQSHLVPSLNIVASHLMSEMTAGEFQAVEIGSDFEVNVDGQPLRTLSGSGKDLANLTLRIALGRILTHKVLPLMLLDEIDSAMDDDRARHTWDCITRITPQIGQVIQASHKELDAESVIAV